MIFDVTTTRDISTAREITYNNFEISLVVFMPNITTNHAIAYTNTTQYEEEKKEQRMDLQDDSRCIGDPSSS